MIVTLGESLMVFNGPPHAPIDRGATVTATFAGAESNVAIGLARLGHMVRWLSVLGDDRFGRAILKTMRGEGVDVSGVQLAADAPTATMFKSRRGWGEPEVLYYRAGSAFSRITSRSFDAATWRRARLILVTGITPALGEGCLAMVWRVISDARTRGIPVWLDPNYRSKLWSEDEARLTLLEFVPRADTILTSVEEGRILTGRLAPQDIAAVLLRRGPRAVIVKNGAAGAYYFSSGAPVFAPAFPLAHLVDPIGAGDAFTAGFLSATLDGLDPIDCLRRGHALGALVCQTEGDWEGLPTRAELERYLERNTEAER